MRTLFTRAYALAENKLRRPFDNLRTTITEEAKGVREAEQYTRESLTQLVDETRGTLQRDLAQSRDEVRGTVELFRAAFDNFQASVEPRVVGTQQRLDSLELRMMTLESEQKDYEAARAREVSETWGAMRSDIIELTRMLRMQGDASDQVAEALGRTIVRLSAEVDSLSDAVGQLTSPQGADRPDHGGGPSKPEHNNAHP